MTRNSWMNFSRAGSRALDISDTFDLETFLLFRTNLNGRSVPRNTGSPQEYERGCDREELSQIAGPAGPGVAQAVSRAQRGTKYRAADPVSPQYVDATEQLVKNPGTPAEFAQSIERQRAGVAETARKLGLKRAE